MRRDVLVEGGLGDPLANPSRTLRETGIEWRPIPGYPHYEASSDGEIRSARRRGASGSVLAGNRRGFVDVRDGGAVVSHRVGHLVALAFLGVPEPAQMAVHRDGDQGNNRVSNLFWGTKADVQLLRVARGEHQMARKTHCPAAHPYSGSNLKVIPSRPTARYCRACQSKRKKRSRPQEGRAA